MDKHKEMTTEKISKLLLKQAGPATIGMLVVSLYFIVDSIFVGRGVGTLGLAAISIAFPVFIFINAISQTIGVGIASILSRALGEKDINKAEKTLGNFFSFIIISIIIFTSLGLIFLNPLIRLFGATENILPYATQYLRILILGLIFLVFSQASNNIIRSQGHAKFSMLVMIIGAITNIILDYVLIFIFNLGMEGAAIATVFAQALVSFVEIYYFMNNKIKIRLSNFRLDRKITKETFSIGSSSFARTISSIIMMIVVNNSLVHYGGDIAVASVGLIIRVLNFLWVPLIGIVLGLQPILGFNYGAKKYARATDSIKLAIRFSLLFGFFTLIILLIFTKNIIGIFTTDPKLISISISAARIMSIALPLIGFQVIASGTYQAIGKAKQAFFLSTIRQAILLIPLIIILPLFFKLNGIFYAFPISDFLAGVISAFMVYKEIKLIRKL